MTGTDPFRVARRGVAYVPEGGDLRIYRARNLVMAARGFDGRRLDLRAPSQRFRALPSGSARWGQLSGGEQQMLTIGRALLTNPDLLILDKPPKGSRR